MKKIFKKQVFTVSAFFLASSIISVTAAFSASTKPMESDHLGKDVEKNIQDQMAQKRQKISQQWPPFVKLKTL